MFELLHHCDESESGAKAYVVMCFLLLLGLHVDLERAFDNFVPLLYTLLHHAACMIACMRIIGDALCHITNAFTLLGTKFLYANLISIVVLHIRIHLEVCV